MNKRKLKKTKIADLYEPLIFNSTGEYKLAETIYLVKYKEIYHILSSNIARNNTYNLLTFKDLDRAKEFMNSVYERIVNYNTEYGGFKIITNNTVDEVFMEDGTRVMYRKNVKLIGTEYGNNSSQQKFFAFSVEEIDLVPYKGLDTP